MLVPEVGITLLHSMVMPLHLLRVCKDSVCFCRQMKTLYFILKSWGKAKEVSLYNATALLGKENMSQVVSTLIICLGLMWRN